MRAGEKSAPRHLTKLLSFKTFWTKIRHNKKKKTCVTSSGPPQSSPTAASDTSERITLESEDYLLSCIILLVLGI